MASISTLTKADLLEILQHCPQRFWPPRPTRQDKAVLAEAVEHAHFCGGEEGSRVRAALIAAWKRRREAGKATCTETDQ